MRFPVALAPIRVLLSASIVLATCPAFAQTGTLQAPARPQVATPVTAPAAAPRQPVRQAGPRGDPPLIRAQASPPAQRPRDQPSSALPLPLPPPPPPPPPERAGAAEPERPKDAATAEETEEKNEKAEASSKLPRFVALRSDEVNMRVGPGTRYPIQWVYRRRDLPVEIEREFEVWRLVRDHEGNRGWMHQATLTGRRSFMVQGTANVTMRAEPKDTARAVAVLQVGVIGRLRSCEAGSDWCLVQTGSHRGYLHRSQIWGVLPDEVVRP